MGLYANLAALQAAVRAECEQPANAKFDAALPRMVATAEARMFDGASLPLLSEPLRIRAMAATATLTLASGAVALPADYLGVRLLTWGADPVTFPTYEPLQSFMLARQRHAHGVPLKYTIDDTNLLVSPAVSGAITLDYYQRPAALVAGTDTNAVLDRHPMIYLQAVLIEAYSFRRNVGEMQKAFGAYTSLAGGLARSDTAARIGGNAPLAPRIPGPRWRQ